MTEKRRGGQVIYFVLAGKRLRYYKDQSLFLNGAQPKGEIILNGASTVSSAPNQTTSQGEVWTNG